ncbi:hypothetical protein WCE39_08010 [Luteimonas sp. MJ174]|uniref:hypothetical protein n=1 Tax=Luteimonas sp. MJ174 TaxID=3129237 RepID=UPI0031B9BE56
MPAASRIAAWWFAWKWVAILLLLLVLSVWFNLRQWRQAAIAPLRDEIAAKDQALELSAEMLASAHERARVLDQAATTVATRLGQAGRDYRAATRARPITDPVCAPGADRVDAINRALGAEQVKP